MRRRSYRSFVLQIGLLVLVVVLVLLPQGKLFPATKIFVKSPSSNQTFKSATPASGRQHISKKSDPTPRATSRGPIATAIFTPTGASVWILSCLDGWQNGRIYQSNPYYVNAQGIKKARDVYVFGHFWLQPDTGALWPYADSPQTLSCLSNLISTVHTQYHARVCGVLGVQESSTGWKSADVTAYTKRAVAAPDLLTPITAQVKKYPYDCLINDVEDGNNAHPEIFTTYEALLHSRLTVPLGQTLIWKTQAVSAYWQAWENWGTLANNADFFIVMALDHDSINVPPVPTSVVDASWVSDVNTYMHSIPNLFGTHPVAWELPTYYRLFNQQNGSWAVSSGTDVQGQITTALSSKAIPKNAMQDGNNPYVQYTSASGQMSYLFFETAKSSDVLAENLTGFNAPGCLMLSFWDNDSSTSNSLGWSTIGVDTTVNLC